VAQPVQPVASSSRIVEEPAKEVIESASSKKAKSKAGRASEAAAVQAEERLPIPEVAEDDEQDSEAELEEEDEELVHEAASKGKKKQKKVKAQKYIPENESKEDRDRRTIFVGNLPLEVAKSKVSLPGSLPSSMRTPLMASPGSPNFALISPLSRPRPRSSRHDCVQCPLPHRQLLRWILKRRARGGRRGRRSEREHGRTSKSC